MTDPFQRLAARALGHGPAVHPVAPARFAVPSPVRGLLATATAGGARAHGDDFAPPRADIVPPRARDREADAGAIRPIDVAPASQGSTSSSTASQAALPAALPATLPAAPIGDGAAPIRGHPAHPAADAAGRRPELPFARAAQAFDVPAQPSGREGRSGRTLPVPFAADLLRRAAAGDVDAATPPPSRATLRTADRTQAADGLRAPGPPAGPARFAVPARADDPPTAAPVVRIHIGRIDVRAVAVPAPPPRQAVPERSELADYLARRHGSRR
jgi:hypothetical protein